MPIYAPPPPPFRCAICGDDYVKPSWGWGPDLPIPPLCGRCNQDWGKAVGGYADRNRDRRILRMIWALAAAIEVEAHRATRNEGPLYGRT